MAKGDQYIAEIECLTCRNTVEVEVKKDRWGWYVIICPRPECKKLAYNSKTPPSKIENRP